MAPARPLGRLVAHLPDHRRRPPAARRSARSCATSRAARPTSPRRRRSGTSPSAPRSPRPSSRTASARARTTASASPAPDGARVFIETTRPELLAGLRRAGRAPRRRALPAAVRHDRAHAALRRRGAGRRAPPRRPREGLRHRDDLHVRRHHRRHLVARAAAADPPDHRLGRPDPARHPRLDRDAEPAATTYAAIAGTTSFTRQGAHGRGRCAQPAFVEGEPRPITHAVKFYEKGDKPLEIVTTRQWYIRNGGRDADLRERARRARRRAALAPAVHAGPLRRTGSRASTATG